MLFQAFWKFPPVYIVIWKKIPRNLFPPTSSQSEETVPRFLGFGNCDRFDIRFNFISYDHYGQYPRIECSQRFERNQPSD